MWLVQSHFGAAWYYAPGRWPTSDGYAPFATVWVAFAAMHASLAVERLSVARAISLVAASDDKRQRMHADDFTAAYGGGPIDG